MNWSPHELPRVVDGMLGFPITPFDADQELNEDALRAQVSMLVEHGARAVFPVSGTGEMQSLTVDEYRRAIKACVAEVMGRVPVLPGAGFGRGIATEMLSTAESCGADGALIFPPYLAQGTTSQGRCDYFASLAGSTSLGLLIYQRDWMTFTPADVAKLSEVPNIVGIKDGTGTVELLVKQRTAVSDANFGFFNGVPTAELVAPAMRAVGINSYSSALLNFVPEVANAFYSALQSDDYSALDRLTSSAIAPFVRIRDRQPGYAVSLVKAGAAMRGRMAGSVRSPLQQPCRDDLQDLRHYLEALGLDHPLRQGPGRNDVLYAVTSRSHHNPNSPLHRDTQHATS